MRTKVLERLKEPSTWAAIGVLALAVGISVDDMSTLGAIVAAIGAGIGVALKEKSK